MSNIRTKIESISFLHFLTIAILSTAYGSSHHHYHDIVTINDVDIIRSQLFYTNKSDLSGVQSMNKVHDHGGGGGGKHKRFKRSYSKEHYLKIMVAYDQSMNKYHQKMVKYPYNPWDRSHLESHIRNYIRTLMAMVAHIFSDESIGNHLEVSVVEIKPFAGEHVRNSPKMTLEQFCRWQRLNKRGDRSNHNYHHNNYDVAILLTRHMCQEGQCDTLGITRRKSMCHLHWSCAVVKDNGLAAAFTIAHEIGHLLGLHHDDHDECTKLLPKGVQPEHRVMSSTMDNGAHPWTWSKCSRDRLTRIFDAGQYRCLLSRPKANLIENFLDQTLPINDNVLSSLPHHHQPIIYRPKYHVHELCEIAFGPYAEYCVGSEGVCRILECKIPNRMECTAHQMPWPDFTACGRHPNQQCYHGECFWLNTTHIERLDGGWGRWSSFSQCSRTCGGGVRQATRECDSPRPANGGKYCVGERTMYRSCNTQPCPPKTIDFRTQQCAEFKNNTLNIEGLRPPVEWLPKYIGNEQDKCKLYCYAGNTDTYRYMGTNVIDGTSCSKDSRDVCVNGKCMPVGCDGKLYSKAKIDSCGVCGGDNSTCQEVSVTLKHVVVRFGYNPIVRIPRGAVNIEIVKNNSPSSGDDHYLALKSWNGTYILNGDMTLIAERTIIPFTSSLIEYSGFKHRTERINATKPIEKPMVLEILSQSESEVPELHYRYSMINMASSGYRSKRNHRYYHQ